MPIITKPLILITTATMTAIKLCSVRPFFELVNEILPQRLLSVWRLPPKALIIIAKLRCNFNSTALSICARVAITTTRRVHLVLWFVHLDCDDGDFEELDGWDFVADNDDGNGVGNDDEDDNGGDDDGWMTSEIMGDGDYCRICRERKWP